MTFELSFLTCADELIAKSLKHRFATPKRPRLKRCFVRPLGSIDLAKMTFDGQIYEYKVFVNNDKDCSKITRGWILSIDLRSMDFQSKCLSSTLASNLRSPSNV